MDLPKLYADSFDFSRWRACDFRSFSCRTDDLIAHKNYFLDHTVGYLEGEKLICRPKPNTYAILMLEDEQFFWFHMRRIEFEAIFGKATKESI